VSSESCCNRHGQCSRAEAARGNVARAVRAGRPGAWIDVRPGYPIQRLIDCTEVSFNDSPNDPTVGHEVPLSASGGARALELAGLEPATSWVILVVVIVVSVDSSAHEFDEQRSRDSQPKAKVSPFCDTSAFGTASAKNFIAERSADYYRAGRAVPRR
jgi:hypothetical protein